MQAEGRDVSCALFLASDAPTDIRFKSYAIALARRGPESDVTHSSNCHIRRHGPTHLSHWIAAIAAYW
jgi:hypothetical protein